MVTKIQEYEELVTMPVISNGAYPTTLTQDVLGLLAAPVPATDIQTMPVGGQSIKFTSDKFVMHRLNDVVGIGGWGDTYVYVAHSKPLTFKTKKDKDGNTVVISTLIGEMSCNLTVLGVTKGSTVDVELEVGAYGTPATNAQARALKRAAMKFGIAAELWEKDTPVATQTESYSTQRTTGTGASDPQVAAAINRGLASPAQVNYLSGKTFQVPKNVAALLTGGKGGEASALIDELKPASSKDEYEDNPTPFIVKALKSIGRADLVKVLADVSLGRDDEDDED